MAIPAGAAVEFLGTPVAAITTTATVLTGAFSAVGDSATFTNTDNAAVASAVLKCDLAVAAAAGESVALYATPLVVDGVGDQDAPDADFQHTYVGSFPLSVTAGTGSQIATIEIGLVNIVAAQTYKFYLQNNSAQTISTGAVLTVTPKAVGAKA